MRIVIVEDNQLVLQVLAAAFDSVPDYELQTFSTAQEGIDACRNGADLAIFDHRLPDKTGADAIRLLRAEDATQHLTVIVITGDDDQATKMAAIKAGATDFLKKPVNIEELRLRVHNLLALHEAQKRAEEGERLLRTVISASGSNIAVLDARSPGCPVVFISDGLLAATGKSKDELMAQPPEGIWAGAQPSKARVQLEKALAERVAGRFMLSFATRQAATWREISLRPVPEPGIAARYIVLTQVDVSDLVSARNTSRTLSDRMSDIARISGAFFFEIDSECRISYVSETMALGLGAVPESVLGRHVDTLHGRFSDPAKANQRFSSLFMAPHNPVEHEIVVLNSADRREHTVQISAIPFTDAQGRFAGYRGSGGDVTALAAARDAAAKLSRAKSAFLATISHEMRTPLTAIIGTAELLRDDIGTRACTDGLQEITQAAQKLNDVLGNVLDLSDLENNAITPVAQEFDMNALLQELCTTFARTATAKGLGFRFDGNSLPPDNRLGDRTRVRQVLHNLLSNAVKFTQNGMIEVKLVHAMPDSVAIKVIDSGIGMTQDEIARAMEPFAQVDDRMAREFEGCGIGLSIAHGLTNAMHGRLDIQSEPNVGTAATLTLPMPQTKCPNVQNPITDLTGMRMLVADDNAANRKILQVMLHKMGAELTMCEDGDAALQAWVPEAFDLLLLDINMPAISGTDVISQIRRTEQEWALPRVPAVAVTANTNSEQRASYFQAGFDACVGKPFTTRSLSSAFQTVLPLAAKTDAADG